MHKPIFWTTYLMVMAAFSLIMVRLWGNMMFWFESRDGGIYVVLNLLLVWLVTSAIFVLVNVTQRPRNATAKSTLLLWVISAALLVFSIIWKSY